MKQLKYLLLLLMAIISQGAWGQECQHTSYTYHSRVNATCETDGTISYYSCDACGAMSRSYLFDTLLSEEELVIKGGHGIEYIPTVDNCFIGIVGHWECWRCHTCYQDEEGTVEIPQDGLYSQKSGHHVGAEGQCTDCGQQVVLHKGENHVSFAIDDFMGFAVFKYTAEESKRLVVDVSSSEECYVEIMPWAEFLDYMDISDDSNSAKRKAMKRVAGGEEPEMYTTDANFIVEEGGTYAILLGYYDLETNNADITLSTFDLIGELKEGENTVFIGETTEEFNSRFEYYYSNPENYNLFRFESPVTGDVTFSSQYDDGFCVALFGESKQFVEFSSIDGGVEISRSMKRGEIYYLGIRQEAGSNVGRVSLNVAFANVATYLNLGENTIDIAANSIKPNSYGWFNGDDAFQYFLFEAPCDGNLTVEDVTGTPGQQLAMYVIETGNVSSDDVPTSMYVDGVTKGTTYQIGLREYNGNALQNVKIRIGIECFNHNYNEDGVCQNEGCTKQIRVLTEGLNEDVDCSYRSERYLFIPETSGKLRISAKNEVDENVNLVYSLYDEEGTCVYTNYVASAPMHKVAKHSPVSGFIAQANTKYLFDFSMNYGAYYDITINVNDGLDKIDGCFEISYYDDDELVEDGLYNTCNWLYEQAGLGEYDGSSAFIAKDGVTYMRSSNQLGAVILPYELQSNENVAYYELTDADIPNAKLEFTKVDKVAPNTPTIYRLKDGLNLYDASVDGPTTIEIPDLSEPVYSPTFDENWSLYGFYEQMQIDASAIADNDLDVVYVGGGQFKHATGTLTIKPYRAIIMARGVNFAALGTSNKAMVISFKEEGGVTTGIQAIMTEDGEIIDVDGIYDVNGRKLDKITRGINIVRSADGSVRKFIKK